MLRTVQYEIRHRLQNVVFYVEVYDREIRTAFDHGFIPINGRWLGKRLQILLHRMTNFTRRFPYQLMNLINSIIFFLLPRLCTKKFKHLNVDIIIDISGYKYFYGGLERTIKALSCFNAVSSKNRKICFLPQAWGPFRNDVEKFWIQKMSCRHSVFFSRDEISYHYLRSALPPNKEIRIAPDIAFLFHGHSTDVGKSVLKRYGMLQSDIPIIGISPNMRVYEKTLGYGTGNEYIKCLESIITFCLNNTNANIVLLPNEILLNKRNKYDDRFLCSLLSSVIGNRNRLCAITCELSAEEIKAIIGNFDFLIGSRFHSLIFALSQHIPVLALGWSHKYMELLKYFEMDKYAVSHEEFHSANLVNLLRSAWDNRIDISEKIKKNLPEIKNTVHKLFDEIVYDLNDVYSHIDT